MDIMIPFSEGVVTDVSKRISPDTLIIGDEKVFKDEYDGNNSINVPFLR